MKVNFKNLSDEERKEYFRNRYHERRRDAAKKMKGRPTIPNYKVLSEEEKMAYHESRLAEAETKKDLVSERRCEKARILLESKGYQIVRPV